MLRLARDQEARRNGESPRRGYKPGDDVAESVMLVFLREDAEQLRQPALR